MPENLIYDCDPGQDDAIALALALSHSDLNIEAITVVGGNVKVDQCAINAGKMLRLFWKENIPVYKGAGKPLKRDLITLECVFGIDGLAGGENLPLSSVLPCKENAIDYLIERLSNAGPISVCATGPLTNIAQALEKCPDIAKNIKRLVIMGGCPFPEPLWGEMGNFTPPGCIGKAEYNFAMDPEAAAIVMKSDVKDITLIGLNITRGVLYNYYRHNKLNNIGTVQSKAVAQILSAVGEEDVAEYAGFHKVKNDPVRAVHDVVAMAYLIKPDLFQIVETDIEVITDNKYGTPGTTIPRNPTKNKLRRNIKVAVSVDGEGIFDLLCEALESISREK